MYEIPDTSLELPEYLCKQINFSYNTSYNHSLAALQDRYMHALRCFERHRSVTGDLLVLGTIVQESWGWELSGWALPYRTSRTSTSIMSSLP